VKREHFTHRGLLLSLGAAECREVFDDFVSLEDFRDRIRRSATYSSYPCMKQRGWFGHHVDPAFQADIQSAFSRTAP